MQYKCETCYDTGSRDKLGTYLDCNACGTAATRRDLNDFVKSLGPTHPEDVALAIHHRALAMAPKLEAPTGDAQKNPQANTWPAEIYLQAGDTDVEAHLSYDAAIRREVTWAAESIDWNDVRYIRADLAAPAAANVAFPELPPYIYGREASPNERVWTESDVRAILAAAGPDAALVKALESALAIINNEADPEEYATPLKVIRAALSGAKGN